MSWRKTWNKKVKEKRRKEKYDKMTDNTEVVRVTILYLMWMGPQIPPTLGRSGISRWLQDHPERNERQKTKKDGTTTEVPVNFTSIRKVSVETKVYVCRQDTKEKRRPGQTLIRLNRSKRVTVKIFDSDDAEFEMEKKRRKVRE